jgi:hypothetical protein
MINILEINLVDIEEGAGHQLGAEFLRGERRPRPPDDDECPLGITSGGLVSGRSIAHFGSFAYPSAKKLPNLSVQFFPFRGVTPTTGSGVVERLILEV